LTDAWNDELRMAWIGENYTNIRSDKTLEYTYDILSFLNVKDENHKRELRKEVHGYLVH
jgi:hypothetical protein